MSGAIAKSLFRSLRNVPNLPFLQASRNVTQSPSGAFLAKPEKLPLGVTKFFVIVTPCIYVGGMISMTGASLLEDYDIFVPEDEDE